MGEGSATECGSTSGAFGAETQGSAWPGFSTTTRWSKSALGCHRVVLIRALHPAPDGVNITIDWRSRLANYSNDGRRSRVRLISKKPSVSVTRTNPSQRRPAASPLGAGVTTGPKMALPRTRMTGVPTSMPT